MVQPNRYYDLQSADTDSPLGYLLRCLLESRVRLGYQSTEVSEEAVNVYLGHLLVEAMTTVFHERSQRYVAQRGADLFDKVEHLEAPYQKFLLYRTNADYRLLASSVFRSTSTPNSTSHMGVSDTTGSTYYHFAAEYNRQIYRQSTSLSEILEILADAFEKYERILIHMRHAYLHLWQTMPPEQFEQAIGQLEPPEPGTQREQLLNAFLDAYRAWRQEDTGETRARVSALCRQLTTLDPGFRFDPFLTP